MHVLDTHSHFVEMLHFFLLFNLSQEMNLHLFFFHLHTLSGQSLRLEMREQSTLCELVDGWLVGNSTDSFEGLNDGFDDGTSLSTIEGLNDGFNDGFNDGTLLSTTEGLSDGFGEGSPVGKSGYHYYPNGRDEEIEFKLKSWIKLEKMLTLGIK